jgi:hypothetical protein
MRNRAPLLTIVLLPFLLIIIAILSGCAAKSVRVEADYSEAPNMQEGEEGYYQETFKEESAPEEVKELSSEDQRMNALQSRMQGLTIKKAKVFRRSDGNYREEIKPSAGAENAQPAQGKTSNLDTISKTEPVPADSIRKTKRMVHYDGAITERSPNPETVVDSAILFIRSIGGVVVSFSSRSAVFNVPVEKFKMVFDSLLTFAEVMNKSISAEDITEQFRDVEVRIKIAKATIERLKALLAKEENDTVKIRLLSEIKALSETVERLTRKREVLKASAEYSTIRFEVLAHHPEAMRYYKHELRGFAWINEMTPLNAEERATGRYFKQSVPKGMVKVKSRALGGRRLWRASSADGAEFWSWKRNNKPRGTTEFWFSALVERKNNEYSDLDSLTAGSFKIIRLRSYGAEPYVYYIGVRSVGKKVEVIETYFPSERQEKRYKDAILAVLTGGKQ